MIPLAAAAGARALDSEASSWCLDTLALVEAAGRSAGEAFLARYPAFFGRGKPRVAAVAGPGNNGADSLVMLRFFILKGFAGREQCAAILTKAPREGSAQALAAGALKAMGVAVYTGSEGLAFLDGTARGGGLIIDGIAGTGLDGPLREAALDMVLFINGLKQNSAPGSMVVSVDLPSGSGDRADASWPVIDAGATLAVEPLKTALYKPALRKKAGTIVPVTGIFPQELIARHAKAGLWTWDDARFLVEAPAPDAHKYGRGLAEIWAGSDGLAGAARIAGRGAAAAGAGLVRLMVDPSLYPILASSEGGVMVVPADGSVDPGRDTRFKSDVILAGPGWGQAVGREALLERVLGAASLGTPVLLDADALTLAGGKRFQGPVLITPHPGELEAFSGIPKEEALARPDEILPGLSRDTGAVILYKSHVMWIAAPDGRLAVVDGMVSQLAAGGSGDLLAGLASGFAARKAAARSRSAGAEGGPPAFDWFPCALAAASLLVETAKTAGAGFADPLALAPTAARLAAGAFDRDKKLPIV
jgi:NAD(P)H-hydrate epimerase